MQDNYSKTHLKLQLEYFEDELIKTKFNSVPYIWISDIYMLQDDKLWKGKYGKGELYSELRKHITKQEMTELMKFHWLIFMDRRVRKWAINYFRKGSLAFSSQNDRSLPDVKVGNEWYEFTFADLEILKYKDGIEFENNIASKQKISVLNEVINSEDSIAFVGTKVVSKENIDSYKLKISPESFAYVIRDKIISTLKRKSDKVYDSENLQINLVIFLDRNFVNIGVSISYLYIYLLVNENKDLLFNSLLKFKKIYFLVEDKLVAGNFNHISAVCFYIDKKRLTSLLEHSSSADLFYEFFYNLSGYVSTFAKP